MKKTFFGIMLLLVGGILLLNVLELGWIFKLLISIAIIIYALKKIKRAETSTQKGFGIGLLLFGFLLLFGGVNVLIGLFIGLTLIFIGFKLLKQNDTRHSLEDKLTLQGNLSVYEDAFDMEWNKKMKKEL